MEHILERSHEAVPRSLDEPSDECEVHRFLEEAQTFFVLMNQEIAASHRTCRTIPDTPGRLRGLSGRAVRDSLGLERISPGASAGRCYLGCPPGRVRASARLVYRV